VPAKLEDALVKLLIPEKVLLSVRRVDEAVRSVPVKVIGEEPKVVNSEQDTEPEHETEVVAMVLRVPAPWEV
jgi:hypothetical protein